MFVNNAVLCFTYVCIAGVVAYMYLLHKLVRQIDTENDAIRSEVSGLKSELRSAMLSQCNCTPQQKTPPPEPPQDDVAPDPPKK
jgi:hypothetical protein